MTVCSMIHDFMLPHTSHTVIVRTSVFMDSSITVTDKVSLCSTRTTSLAGASKKTFTLLKCVGQPLVIARDNCIVALKNGGLPFAGEE